MIRLSTSDPPRRRARPAGGAQCGPPEPAAYGAVFWYTYAANLALILGASVMFRYADFVTLLGGTEWNLGLIAGVGMAGALSMRIYQCFGVDRTGPRLVWLLSLGAFTLAALGHLWVESIDGPMIFLLRILLTAGMAGAHGASMAYISLKAPYTRLAEMLGMVGSSGFIAMMIGPTIADWIFTGHAIDRTHTDRMFLYAALMGCVAIVCAVLATRGHVTRRGRHRVPVIALLKRYHPGPLLLVAVIMGLAVNFPQVFVRKYTESLGIAGIRNFFIAYAVTALIVRVLARQLPDRAGVRPTILWGLGFMSVGMLLYMVVTNQWWLIVPAIFSGVAHGFLFPAVVAGGSRALPVRYRMLGTTAMLVVLDFGNLIGQPIVGRIIEGSNNLGLPGYPVMFSTVAATLAGVAIYYGWVTRNLPKREPITELAVSSSSSPAAERPISACGDCSRN